MSVRETRATFQHRDEMPPCLGKEFCRSAPSVSDPTESNCEDNSKMKLQSSYPIWVEKTESGKAGAAKMRTPT